MTYEVRQDDIMPLADNSHNYWSGYFTSRPALKRQVRFATSYLESARLLEVVTNTSKKDVNRPTYKKEPVVGDSWTDALEGTVGVATHHDGMSGTERQDVTDDYAQGSRRARWRPRPAWPSRSAGCSASDASV